MPYPGTTTYPGATTYPGLVLRDITLTATLAGPRFTTTIGGDVPTTVRVSTTTEYVTATVTEANGQSLPASEVQVGFGSYDTEPTTWLTPVATQLSTSSVQVKILVGLNAYVPATLGRLWLWVRVSDAPEVVPIRIASRAVNFTA